MKITNRKRGFILFFQNLIYIFFLISLIFQSIQDKTIYAVSPKWNVLILGLGFLRPFFCEDSVIVPITGMVLGGGVCLLVYILCHGKGFGGGDVKLAAAGGAMLGGDILYALLFACVCAVFVQIIFVDKSSKKGSCCGKCIYSLKSFRSTFFHFNSCVNKFAFVPYMVLGMEVILFIQILQKF